MTGPTAAFQVPSPCATKHEHTHSVIGTAQSVARGARREAGRREMGRREARVRYCVRERGVWCRPQLRSQNSRRLVVLQLAAVDVPKRRLVSPAHPKRDGEIVECIRTKKCVDVQGREADEALVRSPRGRDQRRIQCKTIHAHRREAKPAYIQRSFGRECRETKLCLVHVQRVRAEPGNSIPWIIRNRKERNAEPARGQTRAHPRVIREMLAFQETQA